MPHAEQVSTFSFMQLGFCSQGLEVDELDACVSTPEIVTSREGESRGNNVRWWYVGNTTRDGLIFGSETAPFP